MFGLATRVTSEYVFRMIFCQQNYGNARKQPANRIIFGVGSALKEAEYVKQRQCGYGCLHNQK